MVSNNMKMEWNEWDDLPKYGVRKLPQKKGMSVKISYFLGRVSGWELFSPQGTVLDRPIYFFSGSHYLKKLIWRSRTVPCDGEFSALIIFPFLISTVLIFIIICCFRV